MLVRLVCLFDGNVQGVGFRYQTLQIAGRFAVTGSVRNCPDGTVEMVAEGERGELDSFAKAIESHFDQNIHSVAKQWSTATGEYASFRIVH